jgi:aminoglycoside phosphotransferase family enzyme
MTSTHSIEGERINPIQQKVVAGLQTKSIYPHRVSKKIKLEETHVSWIFLTGSYAYKIKKQLKFGNVLDFSTLGLRKRFCQREVRLNKILCHEMYKEVVKIIQQDRNKGNGKHDSSSNNNDNFNIRITDQKHNGKALEYAVKMLEIPQKFRMDNLISSNKVNLRSIERLAESLAKFHSTTATSTKIKNYGQPKYIKNKIKENFRTLSKLEKINPKFETMLTNFVKDNKNLFCSRIREGKVRDIHGDLYLKNIFITKNRLYMYDRLEFNDSLRYADIAEDIAHLSMDLDHHKRTDFRKYFVSKYVQKSNDLNLENVLYFWMCYKACVRAKVSFFYAKNEVASEKRMGHIRESKELLTLADSYILLL